VLCPKLMYRVKDLDVCLCTGVWQHNLLGWLLLSL